MELVNKQSFLDDSREALGAIYDQIAQLPSVSWGDFNSASTALILVDVINGFAKEGALSSPRVAGIIPEVVRMSAQAQALGIGQIAFADEHEANSPEFASFPAHCLVGTTEADVVDELVALESYQLITKNSTNGFHEPDFQGWLAAQSSLETLVLVGDCTDICLLQLGQSLKTWYNAQNKNIQIVVPISAVETFDLGAHQGDLLNMMALYLLMSSGIEVVKKIVA